MNYKDLEKNVSLAQVGNKESLNYVYSAMENYINYFSTHNSIPGMTINDLKQECYLSLFKAIKNYKLNSNSFYSYAVSTIKNNLYTLLKRTKDKQEVELLDIYSSPTDVSSNEEDFFNIVSLLEEPFKTILIEHYLYGISLKEIAKKFNIKYITLVKKKDKALNILKHKLKDY